MKYVTSKQIEYFNKENEDGEDFCEVYINGEFEFSIWGHMDKESDLKDALKEEGYVLNPKITILGEGLPSF